jgi:hypothetical protein
MTTPLIKPITRETSIIYKTKPLQITLVPRNAWASEPDDMIEFRIKGGRDKLRVKINDVFRFALRHAIARGKDG